MIAVSSTSVVARADSTSSLASHAWQVKPPSTESRRCSRVDSTRIVLAGHSYGGYVAARTASTHPKVLGVALMAPWDISYDGRALAALSAKQRKAAEADDFGDAVGRLSGATAASLTSDLVNQGPALDLTALAKRRLLIVTATRDDPDDQAIGFLAKLRQLRGTRLESRILTTDHAFNDQRIALEILVLRWLARLPGAPLPHSGALFGNSPLTTIFG